MTTAILISALFVSSATAAVAAPRQARAVAAAEGVGGEEGFNPAKIVIWEERIKAVIANNLTTMCRGMVSSVQTTDETPTTACQRLRDNKMLMRFMCSSNDVDLMEQAVCSYPDIVLEETEVTATEVSLSSSSSSSSSSTIPSQKSSSIDTGASTTTTTTTTTTTPTPTAGKKIVPKHPASDSDNLMAQDSPITSPTSDVPSQPNDQPSKPAAGGPSSLGDDKEQSSKGDGLPQGQISQDSRLGPACNKLLPHLAKALQTEEWKDGSGCVLLHQLSQISDNTGGRPELPSMPAEAKLLLEACAQQERHVIVSDLCAAQEQSQEPTHALQGQQQEHVRYVINSGGLTQQCRAALWPLGEGEMREEAEETCWTLSGSEGEKLVKDGVCTRGDMDIVLEAVCDFSTASALSPPHLLWSLIAAALCLVYSSSTFGH